MNKHIEVNYKLYTTTYSALKALDKLPMLISFDVEVQSIYSLDERAEAKELLKCCQTEMSGEDLRLTKLVGNSSGLSHPKITKVTHFIFGISKSESIIIICNSHKMENTICNWVADYKGKLIVHNVGYDLKIIHERTGRFPIDFEDTQLLAKCLINDTDDWKARVGLKHLMGSYFDPRWTEIESYDIQDYKNEAFLRYSAIDGAATYYLWEQLQETLDEIR